MQKTLLILALLLTIGCNGTYNKSSLSEPIKNSIDTQDFATDALNNSEIILSEEIDKIGEATRQIQENSENIDDNVNSIKTNIDILKLQIERGDESNIDMSLSNIDLHSNNIKLNVDSIDGSLVELLKQKEIIVQVTQRLKESTLVLKEALVQADKAEKQLANLNSQLIKKDKELFKMQERLDDVGTKYLGMLVAFGGILVVIGIVALFLSPRVGIICMGLGAATSAIAAGIIKYFGVLAIGGMIALGIGAVLLVAYLAFELTIAKKKGQANEENIELIEAIKERMPDDDKEVYFGGKIIPGISDMIQSRSTKKIVDKVRRTKLRKKMESVLSRR